MRNVFVTLLLMAPLSAVGQHIGNPGGKAFPLGVVGEGFRVAYGYAGIEGGYLRQRVDSRYDVVADGVPGVLRETSTLQESYFAIFGGTHVHGFEVEGRVGGSFQDLHEGDLTEAPYDDGGGVLLGLSGRWGFSPVEPVRLGIGGQFMYSYSEGDAVVVDGDAAFREDIELELFRGQLFTGFGVDISVDADVTISPYVGVAADFIDGELNVEQSYSCCYWREEVGDFDEDRVELFFGGVDVFVTELFRAGVEGRGNAAGWGVTTSLSWRF